MPGKGNKLPVFFFKDFFLLTVSLFFISCSFDYTPGRESEREKPDITMEDVEYVRVRGGDPLVRFQAESAERWEDRQIMGFKNFTFEQMEDKGETINATGSAGAAVVQTGSGDISLSDGVEIDIKSEDIIIRTGALEWIDKEKHLLTGADNEVQIESSEGTSFLGRGFSADARNRTWVFTGKVEGIYVESEDDEKIGVITEWVRKADDNLSVQPLQYSQEEIDSGGHTPEEEEIIRLMMEEK